MSPYRTNIMTPEEEVAYLRRLLASAEARLQPVRGHGQSKSTAVFTDDIAAQIASWQSFYHDYFGLDLNCSSLRIPERQKGFDRLLIVAQEMTPNRLYDKCAELFPCWKYADNLDSVTSDRKPDQDYAILVRDRVEADEELKNKSANDLETKNILGITLEERLLYELKYFLETGKHLDVKNITLCSGSRHSHGGVPSVDWCS